MRTFALAALAALCLSPASLAAEKNPNAVLSFDWNNPGQAVMQQVVERLKVAADHNAKMLPQLSPAYLKHATTFEARWADVINALTREAVDRRNKTDGLMSLAAAARQELSDGTPVAEYEDHRQDEGGTTSLAKQ